MRRGRVVDITGCVGGLAHLIRRYRQPVPAGGVVVACRPLPSAAADQKVTRRCCSSTPYAPLPSAPARLRAPCWSSTALRIPRWRVGGA
ncbi:hypothetical protein [Actinoplanes sp. NPDC049599]|uniref:hypothetical protein n=1 Tax=Actinoplanes sp. NPDC049599 TaxID=3363903 RepID=UPI003793EB1B